MGYQHGAAWTDDRVATLTRLWTDGFSCSSIANQLGGTTRNAVIGKVMRLGLPPRSVKHRIAGPRSKAAKPYREYARAAAPRQRVSLVPILPSAPLPDPTAFDRGRLAAGSVTLIDLEPHHCRWPVGSSDLTNHRFCGCQKLDGLPYCEPHAHRAYTPDARVAPLRRGAAKIEVGDATAAAAMQEFLEPA